MVNGGVGMKDESNKTNFIKAIDQTLYESRKDYKYTSKPLKNINMSLDYKEIGNFSPKYRVFKFNMNIDETITIPDNDEAFPFSEIAKLLKRAIVRQVYGEIDSKISELYWNLARLIGKYYDDDKEFREMYKIVEELKEMIKP